MAIAAVAHWRVQFCPFNPETTSAEAYCQAASRSSSAISAHVRWRFASIPANVAKNRSRRHIDMQPALIAWLATCQEYFKNDKPLVQVSKLRNNKPPLLEASEVKEWPDNGLRHSFGSYHYAQFQNAEKTSFQMGNTPEMVFKHYKALVLPSDAQKFWDLRPKKP